MAKPGAVPTHSKDEILDAAVELIDANGTTNFSIRSLAKRVGLSPMGIYTYFSSREDILAALLNRLTVASAIQPVPGERWDDTIRRLAHYYLSLVDQHPEGRLINYELRNTWARTQYRNAYLIHRDQGMPTAVYRHVYCAFNSFLSGFLDGQVRQYRLNKELEETKRVADEWESIVRHSFSHTTLDKGVETIVRALTAAAAPDPCEWYTPTDPALWTWKEDAIKGWL